MVNTSVIETGVDKLVGLIKAKKKLSVQDAGKTLGVGPVVVQEWADFLEEEGIISIVYKFATPYLCERKLSREEVKTKEKEFHGKKEGFIRKAEVALANFDREGDNFLKFKNGFENLKKELGTELGHVESELGQLEKFEDLKRNIDKQIMEQEKGFRAKIDTYSADIKREQQKYQEIIDSIDSEEDKLDRERLEAISLREKEMNIRKKLEQFRYEITKISTAIKDDESLLDNSGKRIRDLKKLAEKVKNEIVLKREKGKVLIEESTNHKTNILALQKEILAKVQKNKQLIADQIEKGKSSTKKFREFFTKKTEIEKLIKNIDIDKDELEQDLILLIKKAKAFHLSSKSSSLKGHVKELEETFATILKKKKKFEEEAIKLGSILKTK
ncbi:MAG: hypothetical protein ABIA37_01615 [Candidatus Woesearchaeota archaeon]